MRKIAVQDTCILIDLTDLEILKDVLKLPYEFVCTDLVLLELRSDQQKIIQDHRISIIPFTESELISLFEELRNSPGLTAPDLSCLLLTKKECGILLTSDGALRKKQKI
ncbi:type II toxin-antitoxin system VapC family toxin [Leptospira langatensis]|uniref:Type II toxin-antitoxin system VapC family toxin n=1 Tax=Leptospira langatensis TaxID=2484983 RepID=A0A5F1ZSM1_9LEPT|nr:type II toxin-antitoxin system VapC family toxin [Leptospira langatensis]TGK00319.1 type II toxin-antitoxin system VapC family toxin [Leptospira langatensis]TGL41044.1 type II toxin-antitoxin system VapC family toxin [Leptospira langatensis]